MNLVQVQRHQTTHLRWLDFSTSSAECAAINSQTFSFSIITLRRTYSDSDLLQQVYLRVRYVGLSVGDERVLWKNVWLDRDGVWNGERGGLKELCTKPKRANRRHLANTVEGLWAAAMSGCATRGCDTACSEIFWTILLTQDSLIDIITSQH